MRHPKPLPRSLTIAMFAGQFRLDRSQLIEAARSSLRSGRPDKGAVLDNVREARACNWAMIHRIKAARAVHRREVRGTTKAVNLRVLDHQAEVIRLLKDKVGELETRLTKYERSPGVPYGSPAPPPTIATRSG